MLSLAVKQKMKRCKKEKPQVKWTGMIWCLQEQQPPSALNTRVFLLHIGRSVRYKLSTPTCHPMGILPRSCLCVAGKLASVSSNLQQAPGKHEPDGPLTHSNVLEEEHPHFPPPRAIKCTFFSAKGRKNAFGWHLTPIMNCGSRV